jgi:toxin ParE1/3/4
VRAIEAAIHRVQEFPLSEPARDRLAPGLRVTFHSAYAIYYAPRADALVIIRVLHGSLDAAALVERGGFTG